MACSSYGSSTRSSGVVRIVKDLDVDLAGRHVLLVEDIIDSGLTLSYLRKTLAARNPASLEVCALLVRESALRVDLASLRVRRVPHPGRLRRRLRARRRRTLARDCPTSGCGGAGRPEDRNPSGVVARLYAEAVRPLVMGVLNVTPDSFSDGGLWFDPDAAVAHGLVAGRSRGRHRRRGRGVDAARRRAGGPAGGAAPRPAGRGRPGAPRAGLGRHAQRRHRRGRHRPRAHARERRLGLLVRGRRRRRRRLGGDAHGRASPAPCRSTRPTPTSSPRCGPCSSSGPNEPSPRRRRGVDRPGVRLRQDRRSQPGLARPTSRRSPARGSPCASGCRGRASSASSLAASDDGRRPASAARASAPTRPGRRPARRGR